VEWGSERCPVLELVSLVTTGALLVGMYLSVRPSFGRVGTYLPDTYIFGLALFAIGAAWVAVTDGTPEALHVAILGAVALASGAIGGITFALLSRGAHGSSGIGERLRNPRVGPFDRTLVFLGLILAASVSLATIYITLTIVARQSTSAFIHEGGLLVIRKAFTSGDIGYFAPGYVKQFRDILAPVVLIAITWGGFRRALSLRLAILGTAGIAILLSGQRLPLVVFVASILVADYLRIRSLTPSRMRPFLLRLAFGGLILIVLLSEMNVLLGRVEEGTRAWIVPVATVGEIVERAVLTVPRENVETLGIWGQLGPTQGASWVVDLSAILPGAAGETLSNVLHMATGGSSQGNVVLALASDLWVAWGWLGVVALPCLFGLFLGVLDVLLFRVGSVSCLAARTYLWIILPIIYSPYGFVLYGGAFVLAILAGNSIAIRVSRMHPSSAQRVHVSRTQLYRVR